MLIYKGAITQLAGEGYVSLQVPEYEVFIGTGPHATSKRINVPDDWFCRIKSNGTPCVGKESGFLHLTRKGFNANYNDLKNAFELAIKNGKDRTGGIGWQAFVRHANDHFANVQAKLTNKIGKLNTNLVQLNKFVI